MKILVTGANGQLGRCIRLLAPDSGHSFVFTDVVEAEGLQTQMLDITNQEAVRAMVAAEGIEAVVNCAAYTNVDAAEENYELADLLNAKAPENLAVAMCEVRGLLIHISTDYVFGGDPYNTPCREEQTGTPTGVYGLTKLRGEEAIAAVGCRHIIIRTAWLYSEFGKNFCKTMLQLTATKPQLKVVFDQVGTPTYARDLAEAIMIILSNANEAAEFCIQNDLPSHRTQTELLAVRIHRMHTHRSRPLVPWAANHSEPNTSLQKDYDHIYGIYHYSNEGVCSWYDFAKTIAEYAGHTECDIQPCHSDEFPSKVIRPAYSVLDKTKIKETFGLKIPYWTDSLRKCINNIQETK